MNNSIYKNLLLKIIEEKQGFDVIINADNVLGLNVTSEDIINYLEFAPDTNSLNGLIVGNIIITEGDVLSIIKLINDLKIYTGEVTLYINDDTIGTNTYLAKTATDIYNNLELDLKIVVDYSNNYNAYVKSMVTIIGSKTFIEECENDFTNANKIVV